uniref:hypothetical protein n=1 Tax=Streptomyces tubercidicus TaxID=47759 RepID=UPI0030E21C03|nr:hypothetical protein OG690_38290 [Streptomyces tubercidicus]
MTQPNGCRWCDIDKRPHGRQWTEEPGWHAWEQPTQDQIKARMLARRADRPDKEEQ